MRSSSLLPRVRTQYGSTFLRGSAARCSIDGEDLGGWMVENGWTVAYRKYSEFYLERHCSGEADWPVVWRIPDAVGMAI
jgi:hypothetical protein